MKHMYKYVSGTWRNTHPVKTLGMKLDFRMLCAQGQLKAWTAWLAFTPVVLLHRSLHCFLHSAVCMISVQLTCLEFDELQASVPLQSAPQTYASLCRD